MHVGAGHNAIFPLCDFVARLGLGQGLAGSCLYTQRLYGRQLVSIFEQLNDRQFEIHVHMRTGDLLALEKIFPATSNS